MRVKHSCIVSYFFFTPSFLLVSIALTVINTFSACLFDFGVGRINTGTFGTALPSRWSGHSRCSMLLSYSISDWGSEVQSSSLSYALSKSPFQWGQSSMSEMLSGALSSSLSTGWWLFPQIQRTFNTWVHPPGRSFADKGGRKWDLSDNVYAAAPSCWKSDHDALTISSMSEMYHWEVICLFWTRDSYWASCTVWLPCHVSKELWTLGILWNVLSSASFFISESFLCSLYTIQGQRLPKTCYWHKQTASEGFFAMGLACGFWLPPANHISAMGKTGLHSDTMWYDREDVLRHIGDIGVLWVSFLLLTPPVGYER